MKTISVFGATGKTGVPFVKQALEKGYFVRALVRKPGKVKFTNPNLLLIKGDVLDPTKVNEVISGSDAVVSLLGHVKDSPEDLQVKAIKNIIQAMEMAGVTRLISVTGGGVRDPQNDQPGFMDKLIVYIMKNLAGKGARAALLDGRAHAEMIRQSGLDWTIVRGPMLTDDPAKGNYQVGYVGKLKGFKLTRADLASFILVEIEKNSFIKKMPFIVN
ncbi:MAG: NAD(P)-dependent oxidoreductase [Cytophagaceae bacterium]